VQGLPVAECAERLEVVEVGPAPGGEQDGIDGFGGAVGPDHAIAGDAAEQAALVEAAGVRRRPNQL